MAAPFSNFRSDLYHNCPPNRLGQRLGPEQRQARFCVSWQLVHQVCQAQSREASVRGVLAGPHLVRDVSTCVHPVPQLGYNCLRHHPSRFAVANSI